MKIKFYKAVNILLMLVVWNVSGQEDLMENKNDWEVFPILNYDTDVGFGYGAKMFFYNFLNLRESVDLTAYNSTKGERWYRVVFSYPDRERRQGKDFGSAIDVIVDYDKWISQIFYSDMFAEYLTSIINRSKDEKYVREPVEISIIINNSFSKDFIVEAGIKYKGVNCFDFEDEGNLKHIKPSKVKHVSAIFNFRIDTRTSFINPRGGLLLQISNEYARDILGQEQSYYQIGLLFQSYLQPYSNYITLASRVNLQYITNQSYQNSLRLGGNNSIRGLPQDRYLSQSSVLVNNELRFDLFWKFGGVLGIDAGNSTSTPNWIANGVIGLRLYLENFIVRADFGFGHETTGFYFNFGHLF